MTPQLKQKLEKCGSLLAQSLLNEEIKEAILNKIDKMTEANIDQIIISLEREEIELDKLTEMITNFGKDQTEAWKQVEKQQEEVAAKMLEDVTLA